MTAHDWNIIAGVYFFEYVEGTKVKVIIEGPKDLGFSGEVTSGGWSGEILIAMRHYLNATNSTILEYKKRSMNNLKIRK
jgi:hypothetical protein